MEADRYLANARSVIARAETRRNDIDVQCEDCRFYNSGGWMSVRDATCSNPIVKLAAATLDEKGYNQDRLVECDEQRSADSVWGPVVCGPPGALFEPR